MIGDKPELSVARVVRIVPQRCRPEVIGAEPDSVVEHIEGGAVLVPDDCPAFFSVSVPPTRIADLIIAAANTIEVIFLVYIALFEVIIILPCCR